MQSKAATVKEYLAALPDDRRKALVAVRKTILANLPDGYEEVMNWGMITYQLPLETFPDTYNGRPLMYAALASQKNHMAVYLSGISMDEGRARDFEKFYRATGKRMDIGKSCVRFRKREDLPLDLIGEVIGALPVEAFVEVYRRGMDRSRKKGK